MKGGGGGEEGQQGLDGRQRNDAYTGVDRRNGFGIHETLRGPKSLISKIRE